MGRDRPGHREPRGVVRGEGPQPDPLEYGILELLLRHPRKALPREYFITQVWGGIYGPTKTLDVHIRHLREKIERDPAHPRYIVTVRGVGYKLDGQGEG